MVSSPLPLGPADESPFARARLLEAARKHLPLIISCCVAVIVATLFWTLGQAKVYRAEAMLRLDPDPPRPLGHRVELLSTSTGSYWNRREFYESEFRIMRSMKVALATVRSLGLNADPGFMNIPAKDRSSFRPADVKDAAELLIQRLSVEPVKESSLAVLRYEDTDPERCQVVLNAVVRIYLAQNLENTASMSTAALEWLNTQLDDLKGKLKDSEVALNEFRQKNNVLSISLEDRHNLITTQLEGIVKDLATLSVRRAELAARSAELNKLSSKNPQEGGAVELLQSSVLSVLRTSYNDQKQKLEELLAVADEQNPKVIGARRKLDETAAAITKEIDNIKAAAAGDLRRVNAQIADLKKKDDDIQKLAHELQAFEIPYNQLARTRANNEKIYGLVLERARETDLTRMMNFNNVRVIDEAFKPKRHFKPNTALNLGMGTLIGLVLGIALALGREWSDRSVKTPGDVETGLGLTCLGLLPEIEKQSASKGRRKRPVPAAMNDRDLIVAAHPDGGVAEAARAVRTNLMFMSPDRPYHTLLVTSAIPEEGKTTVAVSLATVLAQSGLRVLLVDTDLRRPRLHRTFKVSNDIGVTMAVAGQVPIDECVRETQIPNLSLLTAGPIPPNPAEILNSDRFKKLKAELGKRFDRIVFDSPPVLPVTDAAVLSQQVDGVVLVVRGFRTQKGAARQAARHLLDVKAPLLGVVLNAIDLARSDYREYHYYYKRDGYYAADERT